MSRSPLPSRSSRPPRLPDLCPACIRPAAVRRQPGYFCAPAGVLPGRPFQPPCSPAPLGPPARLLSPPGLPARPSGAPGPAGPCGGQARALPPLARRPRCFPNWLSWRPVPAACSPTAPPCRPRKPRLSWSLRPATPGTPRRGSRTRSPARPRFGARAEGPSAPRAALGGLLQGAEVPPEGGQAGGGAPQPSTKASGTQPGVSPEGGGGRSGGRQGRPARCRPPLAGRAHRAGRHRRGRGQPPSSTQPSHGR